MPSLRLDRLDERDGAPDGSVAQVARVRARLLMTLAFAEHEVHGIGRALSRMDEAERAARVVASPELTTIGHDLRGLLLFRAGRLDEARTHLDRAVAGLHHLDEFDRTALLLNRGSLRLLRHDVTGAREDLRAAAELAGRAGLARMEFKARHNLGYAAHLAGDVPAALAAFAEADRLEVDVSRSVWHLDRARVLREAGLLAEAAASLREAERLLASERARQDAAEARLELAELALARADWDGARALARRAGRDFVRRGATGWATRADLTRWEADLSRPGGARRVVAETARALDGERPGVGLGVGLGPADRRRAQLLAAQALLGLGRPQEAAARLAAAGPARSTDPLTTRLHRHLVVAGVAHASGRPAAARRALRTGLTTLAAAQARHHSLDLRTAMAVHGARLTGLDLRLAAGSGSPARVLDAVERWRAMSHRRTAVRPPADPALADRLTALRLVDEQLRGAVDGPATAALRRRRRRLEDEVREREWLLTGEGRSQDAVRLAGLRPLLAREGTDLVEHVVLDEVLHAVCASAAGGPRGARLVRLGPWAAVQELLSRVLADLDALSGPLLPAPLRAAVAASLEQDLERLGAAVLPRELAGADRLLVVPSRTLPTVPWSLLPDRRGRATTVSLSATAWARHVDRATGPSGRPRVAALAGPGLPGAASEVEDVAGLWSRTGVPAQAVAPARADAGRLATALTEHDLVHIAAHGRHNQDNPLFSSVLLTGGPLFAYDVPQDAVPAAHVVLSACELGLATPRPGGEVLGLTAALLSLGTRCVVSAVSRVDDEVAHATMRHYHRALAGGRTPPAPSPRPSPPPGTPTPPARPLSSPSGRPGRSAAPDRAGAGPGARTEHAPTRVTRMAHHPAAHQADADFRIEQREIDGRLHVLDLPLVLGVEAVAAAHRQPRRRAAPLDGDRLKLDPAGADEFRKQVQGARVGRSIASIRCGPERSEPSTRWKKMPWSISWPSLSACGRARSAASVPASGTRPGKAAAALSASCSTRRYRERPSVSSS